MQARTIQLGLLLVGLFALSICLANILAHEPASALAQGQAPGRQLESNQPEGSLSGCDPDWTVVPSPNVEVPTTTQLAGVAAVSANEVWAVGYYLSGSVGQTFIMRWNGSSWTVYDSPNAGAGHNSLTGVVALSASDVWAVGYYLSGTNYRTLIEHWNGTAWSIVASPNMGTENNFLTGVSYASVDDVWAVGYFGGVVQSTLIEHWNGSVWSMASSPNVGAATNILNGVAAASAGDVWAVGYYSTGLSITRLQSTGTAAHGA